MAKKEIKLTPGSVYIDLHHQYQFRGKEREDDKYLVVLGEYNNVYLTAITTSKMFDGRRAETGCHHTPLTYYFVKKIKETFPKDTWIILDEPDKTLRSEINSKYCDNKIKLKRSLSDQMIRKIVTCLEKKNKFDMTEDHSKYLKWAASSRPAS